MVIIGAAVALACTMINFGTIHYLQFGNERQQAAYNVLAKYKVMDKLAPFNPLLAGTIPIGIDVAQSDLDIVCCWRSKAVFCDTLLRHFSTCAQFTLNEADVGGHESVVASFYLDGFEIEVFGQNRPSQEQEAYRHMLIEYKLLQKYGESFKQEVLQLKQQGFKTEPAFAKLLNLAGDPYDALLQLDVP